MSLKVRNVVEASCQKIVETNDLIFHLQQAVAEVTAEKSRSSGNNSSSYAAYAVVGESHLAHLLWIINVTSIKNQRLSASWISFVRNWGSETPATP